MYHHISEGPRIPALLLMLVTMVRGSVIFSNSDGTPAEVEIAVESEAVS